MKPDSEFWFGTNSIGQDLWSRVWSGTRTSLFIGFSVAMWEVAFRHSYRRAVGLCAHSWISFYRGCTTLWTIFRRRSCLSLFFLHPCGPAWGADFRSCGLTDWLTMARFVRNQIVIIRDRDYNLASRLPGHSDAAHHYVRNLLPLPSVRHHDARGH